jgi:hypothetical protein
VKYLFFIFLLASSTLSFSQHEFQIETNLGLLFQKEIDLNNEKLESTGKPGMRIGINYLRTLNKSLYLETGSFLKYTSGTYQLETVTFKYATISFQVPLFIGYRINDMWKLSIGASVENNKDFEDIALVLEENLRYDFVTKIVYTYSTLLDFSLYANSMFSKTQAINTLTRPKNGIYLGVIFKLPSK